jgi:hypothetical protein
MNYFITRKTLGSLYGNTILFGILFLVLWFGIRPYVIQLWQYHAVRVVVSLAGLIVLLAILGRKPISETRNGDGSEEHF